MNDKKIVEKAIELLNKYDVPKARHELCIQSQISLKQANELIQKITESKMIGGN